MSIGVYKIMINNKIYVGSTTRSFEKRWQEHISELKTGTHENKHLLRAFKKYGEESISFEILEEVENKEYVIIAEQKYIDLLKPEYNIRKIAENNLGLKYPARSEEFKKRVSEVHKGSKRPERSEETRKRMSDSHKGQGVGRIISEETRKKISEASKGRKLSQERIAAMTGVKRKKETVEKVAKANTGKKRTEEQRNRMSESKKGVPWTDAQREAHVGLKRTKEQREKMSGRKFSEETIEKLREARRRRVFTEETKQKIKESWLRRKGLC